MGTGCYLFPQCGQPPDKVVALGGSQGGKADRIALGCDVPVGFVARRVVYRLGK
jgi:hypothetical protein